MAQYPNRGVSPWDDPLRAYIDQSIIDSTAGSATDAGVASWVDNGTQTDQALADLVGNASSEFAEALNKRVPQLAVYATPANFPGIDPTGTTDCTVALQAALDAVPDGGTLVIPPGRYKAAGLVTDAKSVNVEMDGAIFVQGSNAAILRLRGVFETIVSGGTITEEVRTVLGQSRRQAKYVAANNTIVSGYRPGDVVRIFSDDIVADARPGTGGAETRQGEFQIVYEVIGATVYFSGPLLDLGLRYDAAGVLTVLAASDRYLTAPRMSRLSPKTARIRGWRSDTPTANLGTWNKQHLAIENMIEPVVESPVVLQGGGQGITFTGCFGYTVTNPSMGYLVNNAGGDQLGYGILDMSSQAGTILGGTIRNVRHAFTDDSIRILAGATTPGSYGPTRFAKVSFVDASGCSGTAFDTHAAGEGNVFFGCRASGSGAGFGFRGKRHKAISCHANGCATPFWMHDEGSGDRSYGHELVGCYADAGRLDAIFVDSTTYTPNLPVVTIRGGSFESDTRGMRIERSDVNIGGGARLPKRGAVPTSTAVIKLTTGILTFDDNVLLDASEVSSGGSLSFIDVANAQSFVRGKSVEMRSPSTRFQSAIIASGAGGAAGAGKVNLRDVDLNYNPAVAVLAANVATGSRVQFYNPANVAGAVVTV